MKYQTPSIYGSHYVNLGVILQSVYMEKSVHHVKKGNSINHGRNGTASIVTKIFCIFDALYPRHPLTHMLKCVSLHIYYRCLRETNRPDDAAKCLGRALAIAETKLGSADVHVGAILFTLALSLRDAGRPEEAAPLLRRTLEIEQTNFDLHDAQVTIEACCALTYIQIPAEARTYSTTPFYPFPKFLKITFRAVWPIVCLISMHH